MQPPPKLIDLLYKSFQKFMTLDITWLMRLDAADLKPRRTPGDVALRRLSEQQVRSHSLLPDYQLTGEDADRLQQSSHQCLAVFVDNQLAAYSWYAFEGVPAKLNRGASEASGVALTYPRHMAFLYKGFTLPKYRGRGLYGLLQQYALRLFDAQGISTILSTAEWNNASALTSCTRLGFQAVGRICVGGLAGVTMIKIPANARAIDVCGVRSLSELRTKRSGATRATPQTPGDAHGAIPKPTQQLA